PSCGPGGACGGRPCAASTCHSSPGRKCGVSWWSCTRRSISSSSASRRSSSGSASLMRGSVSAGAPSPPPVGGAPLPGGRPPPPPGGGAPPGSRRHDPLAPAGRAAGTRGLTHGHRGLASDLLLALRLVGQHVALVEPHLHADATGGGAGLAEPVVDVGPQRVPGDPALAVALGAGHLGAAQAAGALHLDALGPVLLRVLHGPLHGPPEGDPGGQLVGHALGDQGGVELGLLDLLDVELHLGVAGDLGQPAPQAVGLAAPAPDDDARAGRVHVDPHAVAGALDLDPADGGVGQLAHQVVADLPVLDDCVPVLLAGGQPPRLPVGGDAEPEPIGIDLLAHGYFFSSASGSTSSSSAVDSSSSFSAAPSLPT